MPPAYPHIERYYEDLQRLQEYGGSDNEQSIRRAFEVCLDSYCRGHRERLALVAELDAGKGIRPDGTVKDSLRMARGYWEAKDTGDDLDVEIQRKFDRGYPRDNILFEDSQTAVLVQNRDVAMRVDMSRPGELHRLIQRFLDYELPEIEEFRKAQEQFKDDLPSVLENLREAVEAAQADNPEYKLPAAEFLKLCRDTIGPTIVEADVREMLLQHILTKDIFLRVFGEDQFHRENNIARQLDALEQTFFTGDARRNAIERLRAYYGVIGRAADEIADHGEKQKFLKGVYEDFYKAYNPKAADRLGVVYTPNEIVDFMIRGTDYLLQKHFGRSLADEKVQILDPAAGTGTFVTGLIDYLPEDRLEYKYRHEIHANEVAILPYYIANLNIEYSYKEKMGRYLEFPNLCFVDTLDNLDWQEVGSTGGAVERQAAFNIGAVSEENWIRVQEQNDKTISVIIGNPPYNANQQNENDNNKNREYAYVDKRIKNTYVQASRAQKTKQYDMYKRFIRWASDRLDDDGIIAFITNRAYLDKRQDDGFRQIVGTEFTDIYLLDLGSDVRRNPKISGTMHNPFGIQTGVAIGFFVRERSKTGSCGIRYASREDSELARSKLSYLQGAILDSIPFHDVKPDERHNWLNLSSSNFDNLLPIAARNTKFANTTLEQEAIFALYALGVSTNRDEWVYDFDANNLRNKALFFADVYNDLISRDDKSYPSTIKWSRDLRNEFERRRPIVYNDANRIVSVYRPFTLMQHFADFTMNDVLTNRHYAMFGPDLRQSNRVVCFLGSGARRPFAALAVDKLPSLAMFIDGTQCLPLYRYTADGEQTSNITEWGLQQLREYHKDDTITAEEVFAYTYAVLHDPIYRDRYAVDLLREFPRLPFYEDFRDWARLGQKLLDLHIGFETVEPFGLERVDDEGEAKRVFLQANKERGVIRLDDKTTLTGVPADAWRYVLGSRSALEWVLDQYKEKKPRDATIAEKFNTYRFADYKERVIDLLQRVCTVSVGTMEIVDSMAHWEEGIGLVTYREREKETLFLPPWFAEPEDEEWLAAWQELPWLET